MWLKLTQELGHRNSEKIRCGWAFLCVKWHKKSFSHANVCIYMLVHTDVSIKTHCICINIYISTVIYICVQITPYVPGQPPFKATVPRGCAVQRQRNRRFLAASGQKSLLRPSYQNSILSSGHSGPSGTLRTKIMLKTHEGVE